MSNTIEEFFKVFEKPITYLIKGEYDLDSKFNIIKGTKYNPNKECTLTTKFQSDVFRATDSSKIRNDEYIYFKENQGKILPFLLLQPLLCYQKKDVNLKAMRNHSVFLKHEPPLEIEKPVHPLELPTSMRGTTFYEVFSLTKDEKIVRAYLSGMADLGQWYLKANDNYNGTRSLPFSLSMYIPHAEFTEFEKILEKEIKDSRLTNEIKTWGRAAIFFNHKDFGMESFLQLPEKS